MRTRALLFLAFCAPVVFIFGREQRSGRFDQHDRAALEWLAANTGYTARDPNVTFLVLAYAAEPSSERVFDRWPPTPLDFAVVLENLARFDPPRVVIPSPLPWDEGDEITLPILEEKVALLSDVVAGVLVENAPAEGADAPGPASPLQPIPATMVAGDRSAIPKFTRALAAIPDVVSGLPTVATAFAEIDLGAPPAVPADGGILVPLLARHGDDVYPSVALRALAGEGIAAARVKLGREISLPRGRAFPIDGRGQMFVPEGAGSLVARVGADALFLDVEAQELAGDDVLALLERLARTTVVLGLDDPASRVIPGGRGTETIGFAELVARTLAAGESGFFPRRLPREVEWALWAAVALIGAVIVSRPRRKALFAAFFTLVLYGAIALVVFGESARWWSPVIPLTVLALATLVALVAPPPTPRPNEARN